MRVALPDDDGDAGGCSCKGQTRGKGAEAVAEPVLGVDEEDARGGGPGADGEAGGGEGADDVCVDELPVEAGGVEVGEVGYDGDWEVVGCV